MYKEILNNYVKFSDMNDTEKETLFNEGAEKSKSETEEIKQILLSSDLDIRSVRAKFYKGSPNSMCTNMSYIRVDFLDSKDYPNGIAENSIYFDFVLDFGFGNDGKIYLNSQGHVWLSPKDLKTEKYRYLAMKSITNVALDYGNLKTKFRKCNYKNPKQCAKKLIDYMRIVMESVEKYTNGYPYERGIEE